MNTKVKILILIFLSSHLVSQAQEEFRNNSFGEMSMMSKEFLLSDNNSNIDRFQNSNQYSRSDNLIQIQQIGNYNYSDIYVKSVEMDVRVNQFGDNNYANIDKNAYLLEESILQSGNNNFISDFSLYSTESVNTSYNQYGNNLTIISSGSNSISKNLQINQYGNSGTVYIYNR